MKQIKKLPALVLAICLIISNVTMSFADSPTVQAPTITEINKDITATAEYLKTTASIDASADFYNSSKLLILLLRSGINCSDLVATYLSDISTTYISNGELTLSDPLTDYAYLSIVLGLVGRDATNFNGFNLIEKYETAITNADQTTLNTINPYKLPHLYAAAYAYAKEFKNSTTCMTKLKTAILSYANENGINYWGNSSDNNGYALSGLSMLSSSDTTINALIQKATTFSQTLLQPNGTSAGDFQWSTIPNSDSTAASLTLYSTYGELSLAAQSYNGLLTFKNTLLNGAYSYTNATDAASTYSTIDALYGLEYYRAVLANQSSPFDVSDKIVAGLPSDENETPAVDTNDNTGSTVDTSSPIDSSSLIDTTSSIEATSDIAIDTNAMSPATSDSNSATIYLFISLIFSSFIILIILSLHANKKRRFQ